MAVTGTEQVLWGEWNGYLKDEVEDNRSRTVEEFKSHIKEFRVSPTDSKEPL